jgi:hypothetical protein
MTMTHRERERAMRKARSRLVETLWLLEQDGRG